MILRVALLMCITFNALAQIPVRPGRYEKYWALLHPFAALRVKHIARQVAAIYRNTPAAELDNYSHGGKLDAYRHVFFMAAFAQKIKTRKLRKLGIAHEKTNHRQFLKSLQEEGEVPDSLSSVMDLRNNEVGFALGKAHKQLVPDSLKKITLESIHQGKAFIIKRNTAGTYLDCLGKPIFSTLFNKKWNIPKCLVASDYNYKE